MNSTEEDYVHGYDSREHTRLQDQASTLVELLHSDTAYPGESRVLEAGCGIGAQTIPLARHSPDAHLTAIDISASSVAKAKERAETAGITNVEFQQGDIFNVAFEPASFDHIFVCFVLEHLSQPVELTGERSVSEEIPRRVTRVRIVPSCQLSVGLDIETV